MYLHFSLVSLSFLLRVPLKQDCQLFFAVFTCPPLIYVQSLSKIKHRGDCNSTGCVMTSDIFSLMAFLYKPCKNSCSLQHCSLQLSLVPNKIQSFLSKHFLTLMKKFRLSGKNPLKLQPSDRQSPTAFRHIDSSCSQQMEVRGTGGLQSHPASGSKQASECLPHHTIRMDKL